MLTRKGYHFSWFMPRSVYDCLVHWEDAEEGKVVYERGGYEGISRLLSSSLANSEY